VISPPAVESLAQFLPANELHYNSPGWTYHNNWFEEGSNQAALQRYWQPAEGLELPDYVLYTQLLQAEALKFALEHWRRRKFDTSGALFWMFSDCWGAVGWTVVDYFLRKKPSYYYVRRAFSPILASVQQDDDRLSFWLTNDTLQDVGGRLEYGLVNIQTSETQGHSLTVSAPANASIEVAEMNVSDAAVSQWVAYSRFFASGECLSWNRQFLTGFRFNGLDLPKARFTYQVEGDILTLKAQSFVWQVQIKAPRSVGVSDNFFDLFADEERRIHLQGPAELLQRVEVMDLNI